MMIDYEEDLEDFPQENRNKLAESLVGTYLAESTNKSQQRFHHIGPKSWFKYEELIDDWLDLTVPEAEKRGPALKNRRVGDAVMHKRLLDRESLRATNDNDNDNDNDIRMRSPQGVNLDLRTRLGGRDLSKKIC